MILALKTVGIYVACEIVIFAISMISRAIVTRQGKDNWYSFLKCMIFMHSVALYYAIFIIITKFN
jgi:hypothetical protein